MENLIFIHKLLAWGTAVLTLYMFIPFHYLRTKILKRLHSVVGVLLLPLSLIHCGLSERATGEHSTFGMLMFVLLLIQAVTSIVRKKLGKKWLQVHRLLSLSILFVVILHIVTAIL